MILDEQTSAFLKEIAKRGSVLGLDAMQTLMQYLGNPQDKLQIIHVAGTNGKGSCCCMLQKILCKQGYAVGLYTSPAVFCEEERFRMNDNFITADAYNRYMHRMEDAWNEVVQKTGQRPTIFEVETALAYLYFYESGCDYVIMEVGMGGATDATNVMKQSLCSVIASIGMDHMQFLGENVAKIAHIKAGIIKPHGVCVCTWQETAVADALQQVADKQKADLIFCDQNEVLLHETQPLCYDYKEFTNITVSLQGTFQLQNSVLVLETVRALRKLGVRIDDSSVSEGIREASWPGRMECICKKPCIYIDGAHNWPAVKQLQKTLDANFTNKTITYIIGVLADKEYQKMLPLLLPMANHIYTVTPKNERALSAQKLAKTIQAQGYDAKACDSLECAVKLAVDAADDVILAFGSLSYLGECKRVVTSVIKE